MPSDISAHLYQEEDSKAVAAGRIGDLLVRKQVLEKRSSDEDRKQRFSRYVKNIQVRDKLDRLGTSNYLLVVTSMEKMIQVGGRCLSILMIFLVLFVGLVMGFPTKQHNKLHNGVSLEARAQSPASGVHRGPEALEQQNQVQSLLPPDTEHRHKRRWSHSQHRSVGVLPQPEPEEEMKPFVLDLKNFPELANADISSQNPNIQVTIEVVDDPNIEVEMDLVTDKDWIPPSSPSTVDWLGGKKLFWPLFWGYTDADSSEDGTGRSGLEETEEEEEDDYLLEYGSEEPLPSGVGGDWDSRWNEGWDATHSYYEEGTEEWSAWSLCSVTCGHGERKRTRSCGYSCTLTEATKCDMEPCPDAVNTVAEPFPFEMENGTEPFGTDVDTCEKWLNCKSDFLQRYLNQVLSELPSCPCAYPSAAAYTVVSAFDEGHDRTFRWHDASGPKERLDIYKPSARTCIRSALSSDVATLGAQHCCYDDRGCLITRGKGAGTPNLISTDFSPELHFKVDVLPWILCKGDWSRFHAVRPPNNGLVCPENPHHDVFMNELEEAREY
ncbi:isthmin-2 [Oncorhynchus kisutch]|uniref:Isthmin 2b n=1 Tax=Oncorhynchus kisutch TaxID=8019 RepID=A0A8C7CY10_ONCKI|nr:isthmin-2 [Oncorhynchus kisutch]